MCCGGDLERIWILGRGLRQNSSLGLKVGEPGDWAVPGLQWWVLEFRLVIQILGTSKVQEAH